MIETNRLFFGNFWTYKCEPHLDNPFVADYTYYRLENKYRLFYLPKKVEIHPTCKEIETGICYPFSRNTYSPKIFIYERNIISLRDAFPTVNFPSKLTKKQVLSINELFNEMQCETYNKEETEQKKIELTTANEIKTRVLKQKNKVLN